MYKITGLLARIFYLLRPIKYTLSVCCIVKDEEEYLVEFVSYHLNAGVEHFFMYDNESKTPVKEILHKAGLLKFVTVIGLPGNCKQMKSYKHCIKNYGASSRWIAFLDMDEYIVAKATHGNIPEFLQDFQDYAAVAVNWQLFGSGHHLKRTDGPQAERFIWKAEENFHVNRHVKSIVQPKYVKRTFDPHSFRYKKGYYAVNENLKPVEGSFSDVSISKIQINHYYCRSLEEYLEKVNRGYADSEYKRSVKEFHAHDADANKIKDTTILELFK